MVICQILLMKEQLLEKLKQTTFQSQWNVNPLLYSLISLNNVIKCCKFDWIICYLYNCYTEEFATYFFIHSGVIRDFFDTGQCTVFCLGFLLLFCFLCISNKFQKDCSLFIACKVHVNSNLSTTNMFLVWILSLKKTKNNSNKMKEKRSCTSEVVTNIVSCYELLFIF
jgi:hypothetical protein